MANAVVTGGGINYGDILSSPYGPKGEIAPELALEQQRLNRRQQLAQLLLQQGGKVAPGQMVGRFYVGPDWKEGLTSLGSGIAGLGATIANQREQENIAKEAQQTSEEDIAEFLRSQKDVPAVPPSNLDPGTFGARAQTVSAPAPREAVAQAMMEQGGPPTAPPAAAPVDPILPGAAPPGFSGNYPMGPDESGWAPKGDIQDLNAEAPAATPPPQMQVAQAMVPPMQGPVSEGTLGRERTPEERQAALIRLMASRDPQAAAIGRFMAQQEATKGEKEEQRAFLREENKATRQSKLDSDKAHIDSLLLMKVITTEQANDMKSTLQQQHDETLKAMNKASTEATIQAAKIGAESRKDVAGIQAAGKTSAAEAKAGKVAEDKEQGVETVDTLVASLRDQFGQLKEGGGITTTEQGPLSNVGAGLASSGTGQTVGKIFGTKNQSLRNTIAQQRPILLQAIKKATGMTAKQMDSNVELKLYLSMATDPELDYETNIKALGMIEQLFGGRGEKNIKPPDTGMEPGVPEFHSPSKQEKYEKSDTKKYIPFEQWSPEKKQRYKEFNEQHTP